VTAEYIVTRAEYMTNSNFYARWGILKKTRVDSVKKEESLFRFSNFPVGPTAVTYSKNLRFLVQYNARAPSSENTSIHYKKQAFRSQTINHQVHEVCRADYAIHT
jgi:hypothetical protein